MNDITELKKKLVRTITLKNRIQRTIYADSHGESKEDVLMALDRLIEKRGMELWKLI